MQMFGNPQIGHMKQLGSSDEPRLLSPLRWVVIAYLVLTVVALAIVRNEWS
jgi:hypothetical protein